MNTRIVRPQVGITPNLFVDLPPSPACPHPGRQLGRLLTGILAAPGRVSAPGTASRLVGLLVRTKATVANAARWARVVRAAAGPGHPSSGGAPRGHESCGRAAVPGTVGMRWWPLCFVSLFAMIGAWSLALPVNGSFDEKQHLVRAYAVATGHLGPVGTATDSLNRRAEAFQVPRSLLPVGTSVDCTWWNPPKPASCQRWIDDPAPVLMPTAAGHYSPVYYAAVGVPLALRPDRTGILLARLVSALLAALALASAAWLALRSGRRLLVAAVLLTATPTALGLSGAINPNGLEIAAGILVGTALAAMSTGRDDRATLCLAGVGSLLLLTIRQLGPVLLALVVGAALLLAGRDRTAALARRRDVRWILGGSWAAGVAYAGWWLLYSGSAVSMSPYRLTPLTPGQAFTQLVTERVPSYFKQMVAKFSYGEFNVSPVVIVVWYLMIGLIVVAALRPAGMRARLAVAGLALTCLGVLVALDLHYLPRYGWFAQGRYAMPAAVAVLLLAAVAGRFDDRRGRVTLAVATLTVPLHVYTLAAVMTRFQVGFGAPLDPFGGSWQPAAGPAVPLATLLVGTGLLTATVAAGVTRHHLPVLRRQVAHSPVSAAAPPPAAPQHRVDAGNNREARGRREPR